MYVHSVRKESLLDIPFDTAAEYEGHGPMFVAFSRSWY
jgi:hypothetical protein